MPDLCRSGRTFTPVRLEQVNARGLPLLLCDVDGVLSLWGFDPANPPRGRWAQVEGIGHFLSLDAADHVRAACEHYELVWCTGWEERADEHLPELLNLPSGAPHLRFDGRSRAEVSAHGHWKLPAIDRFAAGRALAWVDDVHDDACMRWAAARAEATLLVTTTPASGLTAGGAAQLSAFAEKVAATRGSGS